MCDVCGGSFGWGRERGRERVVFFSSFSSPPTPTTPPYHHTPQVVNKYIDQGVAELVPGVLFIDEVHALDAECFSYLGRALESPLAPTVVLATNRGLAPVRGSDGPPSPHGVPVDLLDRVVIVRTSPPSPDDAARVLALRASVEGVTLDAPALAALAAAAGEASLRHAVGLLSPAAILARAAGREGVTDDDVAAARGLFWDAKTSARAMTAEGGYVS